MAGLHELHDEECEVRSHIHQSQGGIELHGVEDLHLPAAEHHVLGTQVAVAFAYEPGRAPRRELIAASVEESDRVSMGRRQPCRADLVGVAEQRGEVLADRDGNL